VIRRAALVCSVAALALSACGAPAHQYVSAGGYGMYFALPSDWQQVPAKQMAKAQTGWSDDAGNVFRQTVLWQGAWSGAIVNADQVFAAKPASTPVVFGFVRDLVGVEQQGIGTDVAGALRDVIVPATSLARAAVVTQRWKRAGFTGIHQTATYVSGGALQTTEVVSMLPPKRNRIYALVARCSQTCFTANRDRINAVIASLTFKEPRG
jgi:hypothetical protein